MKNKVLNLILFSAVLGVLATVAIASLGTERLNSALDPINRLVRPMLGFPEQAPLTKDGHMIDSMIVYVHALMLVLFVGWLGYFLFTMIFFRASAHPKADYHGFKSKIPTTLAEIGVVFVEVVLIVCFAVPLWASVMDSKQFPQAQPETRGVLKFSGAELDPQATPALKGKSFTFQTGGDPTESLHAFTILSTRPVAIQVRESASGKVVFAGDNHQNIELLYSNYRTNRAALVAEGKARLKWTGLAALQPSSSYLVALVSERSDDSRVIFSQSEEVARMLGEGGAPFRTCEISAASRPTLVVRVVAEQFSWNTLYPGLDGNFGRQDMRQASPANPFGRLPGDGNGLDDLDIKGMKVPAHARVIAHIASKDVIHCFKVVPMRLCQDAIPGLRIPLHFQSTTPGRMSITCAQLCGDGHATMRGDFEVLSQDEYANWWNKTAGWWAREKPVIAAASFE